MTTSVSVGSGRQVRGETQSGCRGVCVSRRLKRPQNNEKWRTCPPQTNNEPTATHASRVRQLTAGLAELAKLGVRVLGGSSHVKPGRRDVVLGHQLHADVLVHVQAARLHRTQCWDEGLGLPRLGEWEWETVRRKNGHAHARARRAHVTTRRIPATRCKRGVSTCVDAQRRRSDAHTHLRGDTLPCATRRT